MSYTIQYQWRAFRLGLSEFDPTAPDRYAVAIESGSSNCFDRGWHRSRSWHITMLGTHRQVLRQAVYMAGYCELGELKQRGRDITPEGYIGKVRRLLDQAPEANSGFGHLVFAARVGSTHALAGADLPTGFSRDSERWYGSDVVRVRPPGMPEWPQFFALIDPYLDDESLPPYACGEVYGLPSS